MNNFTPRAVKAQELARKEAERLGHERLDTEHLLLGILALDVGVVVHVLQGLGVGLASTRIQVEEMSEKNSRKDISAPTELLPTPLYEKALQYAQIEAKRMGHSYAGTEHLLLGLVREEEGVAAKVLKSQRLDLEEVRREVLKQLDPDPNARFLGVSESVAVQQLMHEFRSTRDELFQKFEMITEAVASLKSEFAQLRTDVLKGNS